MTHQIRSWASLLFFWLCAVGSSFAQSGAPQRAMTFASPADVGVERIFRETLYGGRHRIYAVGEIRETTAADLRSFVQTRGITSARVIFNSPGGSFWGGLALGQAIRDLEFDTEVGSTDEALEASRPGVCASACVYAFAGGLSRYYADSSRLGVHQFYGGGENQADRGETQMIAGMLVAFLERMGVRSEAFRLSTTAGADSMIWLSHERALALNLVNDGEQPTTAEIKLAGMSPYLRLEQQRADATARVLLICNADTKQLIIGGGIVTTDDITTSRASGVTKSYFEFDGKPVLDLPGAKGVEANGATLWVRRQLSAEAVALLLSSKEIDIWTENGTAFRWGAGLSLYPVRGQVTGYIKGCLG